MMNSAADFVIRNGVLEKYTGFDKDITIPNGVTGIGNRAFSRCSSLTSITIPDSVTSIGSGSFQGCGNLRSISIPESVTSISVSAFSGCGALTSIFVSGKNSVYHSSGNCLIETKSKTLLRGCCTSVLPVDGSVTSIGTWAFNDCGGLVNIEIPDSITTISGWAFKNCSSLTSITLPDSITSIGESAFEECSSLTSIRLSNSMTCISSLTFSGCSCLTSISIPDSVTSIGDFAFENCTKLKRIFVANPRLKFGATMFGDAMPLELLRNSGDMLKRLTDSALKSYVLDEKIWNKLGPGTQAEIFLERHGKSLMPVYAKCILDAEKMGVVMLDHLSAKSSAKEYNAVADFMTMFSQNISVELLQRMYERLKTQKSAGKAVETIEHTPALMNRLSADFCTNKQLPAVEQKLLDILRQRKISAKAPEVNFQEYYGVPSSDMPGVKYSDGTIVSPMVVSWLLTTHEKLQENGPLMKATAEYVEAGICPEAKEIIAELDPVSFQDCLRTLARKYLGMSGRTKQMFLAYPICRYADEILMTELTKTASSWRSTVSGSDAPPFAVFCKANAYSNTRAAMLFADQYGKLKEYAGIRYTSEDFIRDKFLSSVGLDEEGRKIYDLGNQKVVAGLKDDLSFLIELPDGKIAKSLPKRGADDIKYANASADFAEMKKLSKKIVKNRADALFRDFLSGRTRDAENWSVSYLQNPLLRSVAKLLVWRQDNKTFTLENDRLIDSAEQPYTIGSTPISVAHPMEMFAADVRAWQKYFVSHELKQLFAQVWEPVVNPAAITENRYEGAMISYFHFMNQSKHGITIMDTDYHNEISILFDGCDAIVHRIDWERHAIRPYHRFEIKKFNFRNFNRKVNHIVGLLDKWTVCDRILKDDTSIVAQLPQFTLAQITDFIRLATENNCTNCTAALLEFKNKNFADFASMEEFALE